MKILIIEDELLAQAKLESMLMALDHSTTIIGKLGSVKEAVQWLKNHPAPDVAFVDIQLSDDHSFEIFRQYPATFPVIFTTAFDKYLLESFEFNSIDYLLKPITEAKLLRSLSKLKTLQQHFTENIHKLINGEYSRDRTRIVVRKGMEFLTMSYEEVAFFYTEHRIVFVKDKQGNQFIIDKTLADLELQADKTRFFRINRKFLASIEAIEKFKSDNGKIKITLKPGMKEDIHVSKETAPEFRRWIGRD